MDSNLPLISVVMSVYNDKVAFLSTSIQSILQQTWQQFEFIIVDDGSTNLETVTCLKEFSEKDYRVRIHRLSKNHGLTKALNIGLSLTSGDYIARQDADDISLPERLEKQVKTFIRDSSLAILGTRYDEIDEFGTVTGPQRVRFAKSYPQIKDSILCYNPFAHTSIMISRERINIPIVYHEGFAYAQDYQLWLSLLMNKFKAENLDQVLVLRRYTPAMISNNKIKQQLKCVIRIKSEYLLKFSLRAWWFFLKDMMKLIRQ